MASQKRTLEDKVKDYLFMGSGTNIVYGDAYYYNQLCNEYGITAVTNTIKQLKQEVSMKID